MYQLAIWLELLICRFRAYNGNGCGIVSPVLLGEYVITRDKDTESFRYGGSIPPMTQKRKQLSRIFTIRISYPYPKGEQQGWKDCSKNSGVIGSYTPLARRLLVRVQSIFKYAYSIKDCTRVECLRCYNI